MKRITCYVLVLLAPLVVLFTRASAQDAAPSGVGEHLVLVVADVVRLSDVKARLRSLNAAFGHLQGFYAEPAEAYDLTGALVQTSPDEITLDCSADRTLDCPKRRTHVNALADVRLAFVGRTGFRAHRFPSSCGDVDQPPCQRARYTKLFGDGLRMPDGKRALVTAFRTVEGAEEFIAYAKAMGIGGLVAVQALKTAGADVGLGQEPHPDGSGPLERELPDQADRQRSRRAS